jgi:periplasmic protein TonB
MTSLAVGAGQRIASGRRPEPQHRPLKSIAGAAIALALHVLVLYALLQLDSVRSAVIAAVPITVSLIAPPKPVETSPKPIPPKLQRPVQRPKPAPLPPVITAAPEARTELVAAPAPPPAPLSPIEAPVLAAAAAEPVAAPSAAVAPPPAPLVPPSFNAAYLNNPAPAYPALSRRMGEEGRVVLRVHVSADGMPKQVELKTSSTHPRLDEAALDAVRRWRFVPARRGNSPVAAWVLVPISFSLRS